LMRDLFESEGIDFTEDDCVDMKKHFWDPE